MSILLKIFHTFAMQHHFTNDLSYNNIHSNKARQIDASSISFLLRCRWCCSDRAHFIISKLFKMQHQKGKNNFQPNPFSLIQTDALAAIKKEINSFFMDIHFEEAQRDLLNISSDIVNKHVLKSHGDMYVRDQQYLLHRIVMLLTKLYLSNPKMECHGNN